MRPRDRSKSICFLTNAYPDASCPYPMYGRFIRELVDHLTENGLTLSVVTPRLFQESNARETAGRERVYRFWFWSDNRLLIEYQRIPVFRILTYLISGVLKTIRIVRKDSCRLIHAHWAIPAGLMAVVVARVLRKPVLLTVHGSDARWAFRKKGLFKMLFRWTAKRANFVTTVSRNIAEEMMSFGIRKEKLIVFPMGVSDEFFSPLPARLPRPEHNGKTVIVSNRHLLPLYNVDCLIRAIPHVVDDLSEVLFLIVGDGERRSELESMARRMRLLSWVQFLGSVAHAQMPGVLRSSQIYVSTSLSDGASVSLLEAMACGLFPVVTDIPANREWIRDGYNGYLVPPDDERTLAGRIKTAARDEAIRKRAGRINTLLARERASWGEICKTLKNLYQRLATP